MRLCAVLACGEFTLPSGLGTTSRATNRLNLFESKLLGLHGSRFLIRTIITKNGQFVHLPRLIGEKVRLQLLTRIEIVKAPCVRCRQQSAESRRNPARCPGGHEGFEWSARYTF